MMADSFVFIDNRVADYETLIAHLGSETEWALLNAEEDGILQIERVLAGHDNLNSIQIISHGSVGALLIGSTVLDLSNIHEHEARLQAIGSSLSEAGDILLYGCNVAKGAMGRAFIQALAHYTQADITASTNLTGATALGGDGILEANVGLVESSAISMLDYSGVLTTEPQSIFLDPNWQYQQVPISEAHYGTHVLHTAHADLNLDGNEDLILTFFQFPFANNPIPIRILLGDGQGGFTDGTSALMTGPIPGTVHPREVVIDDFNNDGYPDIFVADHGYDALPFPGYTNTLLLSDGAGHYQAAPNNVPTTPDFTHSAATGDIDGDGDVDIYVGNIWGQQEVSPYFLINDGHGVFARSDTNIPAPYDTLSQDKFTTSALLDVDGDNDLDLVLGTDGDAGNLSVILRNDGSGRFANPIELPVGPYGIASHALDIDDLDVNADGRMDLIITYTDRDPFYTGRYMQVLVQTTTGSFVDETASRLPQSTSNSLAWQPWTDLVDIDGDADLDIVIQRQYPEKAVGIFLNDGNGVFAAMPDDPALSNFWGSFTLMDVNNDQMLDVVNSDYEYGQIDWDSNVLGYFQQIKIGLNGLPPATGDKLLIGNSNVNYLSGGSGNDVLQGLAGNDILTGLAGNDSIDGGIGLDTARFSGARENYTIVSTESGFTLTDALGTDGSDNLINIERLQFADKKIALDLAPTGNAGQAVLFIGVLAPNLVASPETVGLILDYVDGGQSMQQLNQLAVDIGLVYTLAGGSSNADVARLAFENVVGTATPDMIDMLVGFMDGRSASFTQSEFLTVVANLEVNQANVNLVGLAQTGIEYAFG